MPVDDGTEGRETHSKREREINIRIRGTDKMSVEDKDDENTKQHLIRIFIDLLMCPMQQKRMISSLKRNFFQWNKVSKGTN